MGEANKKNKKRINVIDVVIILLVLALIGTAVYRIYTELTEKSSSKRGSFILSFECDVTYDNILNYLKAGDAVYVSSDGVLLGYLYDVPNNGIGGAVYKINSDNAGGASGEGSGQTQNNKNFKLGGALRLSDDVIKSQNGNYYVLNGNNITVGSTIKVYTEKAVMNIVVKSITAPQ